MSAPGSKPSNLRAPSKLLKPSVVPPKSNDAAASTMAPTQTHTVTCTVTEKTSVSTEPFSPNSDPTTTTTSVYTMTVDSTTDSEPVTKNAAPSGVLTENTDDFIVGNRVWVGGTKPGYIQYIGETQFAPGEWAGVVLDEPIGKNDGSVAGVKYFQCEPKRGVFSRLTKLTREPIPGLMAADGHDGSTDDVSSIKANGSIRSASPRPSTPLRLPRSSTPSSLTGSDGKVKVGDRVQVSSTSGTKVGILRYLGTTEFATGDWAGVELDEASGKNDGSVAGKRYFECPMKYGLFAPVARVMKLGATSARRVVSSTTTSSPVAAARRTGATPKRTGSHESISTVGSTSSAARSIKPRLGITSLTTGTKPSRGSTTTVAAAHTAMQDALKEKEQHIEQLLRERDSVMSEIARATSQRDDVERELANLKTEHGRHKMESEQAMAKLREIAEFADKQRRELEFQLEEERKKVEDLQFRVEEESILKSDLEHHRKNVETMKEADTERIKQLEQLYSSEKARADLLEQECNVNFQNEEKIAKYLDDIEVLQNKVQECEKTITVLKSEKNQESSRAGMVTDELIAKDAQTVDLQNVIRRKEKVEAEMREQQNQLEQTLAEHQKSLQNQEALICDLRLKLQLSDNSLGEITQQVSVLEVSSSDLKRKLLAYEERCEILCKEKSKLENDVSVLMKSTGDNSTHLTKMIEQLREKEKLAEQLQLELQEAHQDVQRLQDVHEQMVQMHKKELETLAFKNEQTCQEWERKLSKEREEMQNCQVTLIREMNEKVTSLELAASSKGTEINKLKALLDTSNCRVESLITQLATAEGQFGSSVRETEELRTAVEQKLTEAKNEINSLLKERNELLAKCNSIEIAKVDLEKQVEYLNQEKHEQLSAVSQRDKKLALLNSEVDRLKAEFNNYKAELQRKLAENELDKDTLNNMRNVTEMQQQNIEELQQCIMKFEEENKRLRKEMEQMQKFETEKQELEVKVKSFEKLCEEASQRESELLNKFASEKEAFCKELESMQTLLVQRTKDLEIQQEEMSLLKIELNSTLDLKNQCAFYQQENQKLRNEKEAFCSQVQRLEDTLAQRPNGIVPEPDSTIQQLLKEKESADDQVNFLNSVIVDMQKKNDELQCRIQVMEVGHLLNDTSDVNLNAVKTPKVAPRLFCDICDRFDIHDTEDCPLQATSDSPPPTQYHGSRNQVRPYCDTCEIFGHWTNECDDNETF